MGTMKRQKQIDEMDRQIDDINGAFGEATDMARTFHEELKKSKEAMEGVQKSTKRLEKTLDTGLRSAIDGAVFRGETLSDALRGIGQGLVKLAYDAAVKPITGHVAKVLGQGAEQLFGGATPFAKGASFSQGRVMPFANGGIIERATYFPMRGGAGLMGEAGPEAIMPLARGADGKLGVRSATAASRPVNVVMNISTRNADSFMRSQNQIAAQVNQALARAQRNR